LDRSDACTADSFRHEAFFYAGEDEFLAGAVPFIEEGLAGEEAVVVAVEPRKITALRGRLGDGAELVRFLDMQLLGRNPGRIIPTWRDFVAEAGEGRGVRGLGEPVWPGRSAAELVECRHHESLLNRAFVDGPTWWLLCPYGTDELDPGEIAAARASHPFVGDRNGSGRNDRYREASASAALEAPLAAPPSGVLEHSFTSRDLKALRDFAGARAERAGLDPRRLPDLVLAVNELTTNSVRHAPGPHVLLAWEDEEELVFEVRDRGRISESLLGRRRPGPDGEAGRGLWLVHQLCDLVELRSSASGSVARLHMQLGAPPASG
jgi:anti-sigma regulatory factor (Ser/Thr protein kinase)